MPRTKNSKISMIIRISRSYLRSRDMNFNSNSSFIVSYSQSAKDFNLIRKVNEKSGNGIFWSVLNGNDLIQRVVLSSRSSKYRWYMKNLDFFNNEYTLFDYSFSTEGWWYQHLQTWGSIEATILKFQRYRFFHFFS